EQVAIRRGGRQAVAEQSVVDHHSTADRGCREFALSVVLINAKGKLLGIAGWKFHFHDVRLTRLRGRERIGLPGWLLPAARRELGKRSTRDGGGAECLAP